MDNSESPRFTPEMIYDDLTVQGRDSIDLWFVLGKSIIRWDPKSGMFLGYMIDNPPFADACRAYLRTQQRYFTTPDELETWAKAHNWPNLKELLPQIEAMRQRKRPPSPVSAPA